MESQRKAHAELVEADRKHRHTLAITGKGRRDFARARGWCYSSARACLSRLSGGRCHPKHVINTEVCQPYGSDHAECWREGGSRGRVVAFVFHPYPRGDFASKLREWANEHGYGLEYHTPESGLSWWAPGRTALVVLTRSS